MAALHSLAAGPATPHAHGEPGHDWRRQGGQVGLEPLGVTLMDDFASALRAAVRQRRVQFPVDTGRGHAMTVTAMVSTPFAARTLGLLRRVALGERCRLTLPRTARLLQKLLQFGDTSITRFQRCDQLADPGRLRFRRLAQCRDLRRQRCYRSRRITRGTVASRNSPSYAPPPNRWRTPLSKYSASFCASPLSPSRAIPNRPSMFML